MDHQHNRIIAHSQNSNTRSGTEKKSKNVIGKQALFTEQWNNIRLGGILLYSANKLEKAKKN